MKQIQEYVDTAPLVPRVETLTIDLDRAEREACDRFLEAMQRQRKETPAADDLPIDADSGD
ncbi:hypothetical protein H8B02_27690 [Bradyrhizobium sp. Pear77]|uniref:hypothetical protein n=1 Tax=Bradyrhizobium altum TaxID=1571202 RepID=UPI001E656EAB|nr:hypothetical protein [Bradyrhizobium altum]MCC8957080.1 hypothetical protein [Bradyrhizobium altum]